MSRVEKVLGDASQIIHRVIDRGFFGASTKEGDLSDLKSQYKRFLGRAKNHIGVAFPELPQEFFADPEILVEFDRVIDQGGSVEIVCHPEVENDKTTLLEELTSKGVQVYFSEKRHNPYTVLDGGKHYVLQRRVLGERGESQWYQSTIPNIKAIRGDVEGRAFLFLRENSQLLDRLE